MRGGPPDGGGGGVDYAQNQRASAGQNVVDYCLMTLIEWMYYNGVLGCDAGMEFGCTTSRSAICNQAWPH